MGRPHDERSTLRPLLAALERQFRASAGDWAARFDAKILRRYQRDLDGVSELLEGTGTDLRELDRARSLAAEMLVVARLLESDCTVEHEVGAPERRVEALDDAGVHWLGHAGVTSM